MSPRSSLPAGFSANHTLFFPISGNPIGFNHFAAAELWLRREPALQQVVFVLSNGRHPDPTKPDAAVPADERLAVCRAALESVADPERSLLARRAGVAGETLRLAPERLEVSTLEFAFDRAVRTAEVVPLAAGLFEPDAGGELDTRLHWFAGTDLIRRMADPRIFSDEDLNLLSRSCRYHVLEREGDSLSDSLADLREKRNLELDATGLPLAEAPGWIAPFLALSSTLIREAVEAGDPIGGMLPQPAAERIEASGHYREGTGAVRVVDADGGTLRTLSPWALRMEALRRETETRAGDLHEALTARREAGRPHTLALVETSTGGLLTALLAARAGASRFFLQSRFAYDAVAKRSLVGGDLPGASAVSPEAVSALANAMREASGADFALAESGMAGPPDGTRHSLKSGVCWFALAGPGGVTTHTLELNPFLTRREHQWRFAGQALDLLHGALERA